MLFFIIYAFFIVETHFHTLPQNHGFFRDEMESKCIEVQEAEPEVM